MRKKKKNKYVFEEPPVLEHLIPGELYQYCPVNTQGTYPFDKKPLLLKTYETSAQVPKMFRNKSFESRNKFANYLLCTTAPQGDHIGENKICMFLERIYGYKMNVQKSIDENEHHCYIFLNENGKKIVMYHCAAVYMNQI